MILGVLKKYSKILVHKNIKKLQIKIQINSQIIAINQVIHQEDALYQIQEL
jgi:hypothetical protein